jgi:hypothetical protein
VNKLKLKLRAIVMKWLKIKEPGFIGLCSYCGETIYSDEEYMIVVRNGWGRPRLALACMTHGGRAKNMKRIIKHRERKPARTRPVVPPVAKLPVLTPSEMMNDEI